MNILYVSNSKRPDDPLSDASTRYRCWYRVEDFRNLGHTAFLTTLEKLKARWLHNFDHVIFHRPHRSLNFDRCLKYLAKNNIGYSCDFDDFIFDPECWAESPAFLCGRTSRKTVISSHQHYLSALKEFKTVFVSTEPLANEVARCHPAAEVITLRNGLGPSWFNQRKNLGVDYGKPSIAYFSGNASHDHDFALIQDSLSSFLSQNKDVGFHVYGHLKFEMNLFEPSQLTIHPYTHYSKLKNLIGSHTVTLSPLVGNRFNSCKSAVKFMESASLGVPCVTSDLEDVSRFQCSGLFVNQSENWFASIASALEFGSKEKCRKDLEGYAHKKTSSIDESIKALNYLEGACLKRKGGQNNHSYQGNKRVEKFLVIVEEEVGLSGLRKVSNDKNGSLRLAKRRLRKLFRDPEAFFQDSRFALLRWIGAAFFKSSETT